MRPKVKKWISIFLVGAGPLLVGMMINFIPTWNLKTPDMHVLSGDWLNVYYETEKDAAKDVFTYANAQTASIAEKLGFCEKQDVNVYIYDYQATMQTKKYGFIPYQHTMTPFQIIHLPFPIAAVIHSHIHTSNIWMRHMAGIRC